jgi:hypothetical protein
MWRHVALVRTDTSEELSASIIRVTRIGELGTTLAVTTSVLTRATRRNIQKIPFFIVTAVKTSSLTTLPLRNVLSLRRKQICGCEKRYENRSYLFKPKHMRILSYEVQEHLVWKSHLSFLPCVCVCVCVPTCPGLATPALLCRYFQNILWETFIKCWPYISVFIYAGSQRGTLCLKTKWEAH